MEKNNKKDIFNKQVELYFKEVSKAIETATDKCIETFSFRHLIMQPHGTISVALNQQFIKFLTTLIHIIQQYSCIAYQLLISQYTVS